MNARQANRDQARATALKKELEDYLWVKLTAAFGEPLRDDQIPQRDGTVVANPDPFGPDGLFDIILHPSILRARAIPRWEPCDGSPRAGLIVLTTESDAIELAHELMHAIALSYPLLSCIDDYHWMDEAIATWAMQFTYPGPSPADVEHISAASFLYRPEERLNLDEEAGGLHQYGAYLWFFSLSKDTNDPGPVRATWNAAASRDSIDAIDAVAGGFEANWGPFLANNWNRVAGAGDPHRDYYEWDELRHQAVENHRGIQRMVMPVFGGVHLPIHHDLLPLAAQYEHFQFPNDEKMQQIWFLNDYAGAEPRARVQAIVKIRNEGWQRAVDWSNDRRHFFCRFNPREDLEELVLVISNLDLANAQDFRPAVPRLGGDDTASASNFTLDMSPRPCNDFIGTVDFETTDRSDNGNTFTTTARATNVRFELDLPRMGASPQRAAVDFYKVAAGQVDWHIRETGANCADRNAFGHFAAEGQLIISLGGPSLFYTMINDSAGTTEIVTVTCEGGPTELQFSFREWISVQQMLPLANGAQGLTGNQEFNPGNRDGWRWVFTRAPPRSVPP
jgi:hypothetical protein